MGLITSADTKKFPNEIISLRLILIVKLIFFILFRSAVFAACQIVEVYRSKLRWSEDQISTAFLIYQSKDVVNRTFSLEIFHEQLPLPVPCYDLSPVTELTLDPQ